MQLHRSHLTHSPWLGGGAAALAVVLWALVPLLAAQAGELPPLRLSALALLAGALGTLPMARRRRHRDAPLRPLHGVLVYLGVPLLITGAVGACFAAFTLAPAEEAALILYTWPVLFLLASQWLVLGRLSASSLIGAGLAFSGAALLVAPQALAGGVSGAWGGYLLAALGAVCWALYSMAAAAEPGGACPADRQRADRQCQPGPGGHHCAALAGGPDGRRQPGAGALRAGDAGLGPSHARPARPPGP